MLPLSFLLLFSSIDAEMNKSSGASCWQTCGVRTFGELCAALFSDAGPLVEISLRGLAYSLAVMSMLRTFTSSVYDSPKSYNSALRVSVKLRLLLSNKSICTRKAQMHTDKRERKRKQATTRESRRDLEGYYDT